MSNIQVDYYWTGAYFSSPRIQTTISKAKLIELATDIAGAGTQDFKPTRLSSNPTIDKVELHVNDLEQRTLMIYLGDGSRYVFEELSQERVWC